MKNVTGNEKKLLQVLKKKKGREYTKKIAEAAGMSAQTAMKYLMALESKELIVKDDSQRPHIFWELATEA